MKCDTIWFCAHGPHVFNLRMSGVLLATIQLCIPTTCTPPKTFQSHPTRMHEHKMVNCVGELFFVDSEPMDAAHRTVALKYKAIQYCQHEASKDLMQARWWAQNVVFMKNTSIIGFCAHGWGAASTNILEGTAMCKPGFESTWRVAQAGTTLHVMVWCRLVCQRRS